MPDCDPDDELIDIVGSSMSSSDYVDKMKLRDEREESLRFSLNNLISSVNHFIDDLPTSRLSSQIPACERLRPIVTMEENPLLPGSNNEMMELAPDEEMVPEKGRTDTPSDTVDEDCQPPPAKIAKIIDEPSYRDCNDGRRPPRQNNILVNGRKLSFDDDSGLGTSGDSNVKSTSAQSDTASNRVVTTAEISGRPRFRRRSKRAVTTNDQVGKPNVWKDSGRKCTEHSEELLGCAKSLQNTKPNDPQSSQAYLASISEEHARKAIEHALSTTVTSLLNYIQKLQSVNSDNKVKAGHGLISVFYPVIIIELILEMYSQNTEIPFYEQF